MWREYVRMELGFEESMRRRWDVLGIKLDEDDQVDMHTDKDDQDAARRAIMQGAIVKSVISNAVKGSFPPPLLSLHNLIAFPISYPKSRSIHFPPYPRLNLSMPCPP